MCVEHGEPTRGSALAALPARIIYPINQSVLSVSQLTLLSPSITFKKERIIQDSSELELTALALSFEIHLAEVDVVSLLSRICAIEVEECSTTEVGFTRLVNDEVNDSFLSTAAA